MQSSVEPATPWKVIPGFSHIHNRDTAASQTSNSAWSRWDRRIQRTHISSYYRQTTGSRFNEINTGYLAVIREDFASTIFLCIGDRIAEGVVLRIAAVITSEVILDQRNPARANIGGTLQMILNFNFSVSRLIVGTGE